jgi:hypothetical protein
VRLLKDDSDRNVSLNQVPAWLCVYLMIAGFPAVGLASAFFLGTLFPIEPYVQALAWVFGLIIPALLTGIGIVTILPFAQYAWMKGAQTNPAIARTAATEESRKPMKTGFGVLVGVAGLTSLFGFTPWNIFLFLAANSLGILVAMPTMVTGYAVLIFLYHKKLGKIINFF